ncbi:MAG TPA: metalloregulator ArsR/SmtB family transcription factor [Polyangiaceae bacterium]|nr:metalloregulator ArsR/SmtB family transcription factor [Polyangiaceae bacterium]
MSRASNVAARKVASAALVFAALGDETRLALVSRLAADGPRSIAELSAGASVTRQAITKHLRALAVAGLARDTRRGRESIWELTPGRLESARSYLDEVSAHWDLALGRLRAFVEEP